ncbi:cupin domain-containing protein [Tepidiforma sp.]|uniref:cupin domain-containing protein n=1 Tax=Tepidiforma sp. TaxID=2682230 RepID=UPI002ADDD44C|nr:cupin domain-containing protein [Tepidiforma sp.]
MTESRPIPVGLYHLLTDYECPAASVRVLRMSDEGDAVGSHVHRRSMQLYVAIEGRVAVEVDGVESVLQPYEVLAVWPGSVHRASPVGGPAVVANISIPPLGADDQVPAAEPSGAGTMRPAGGKGA